MKTFYWLVKREFWEHKGGFFWAPVVTGIIAVVLNVMLAITAEVMGRRFAGNNNIHFHSNFDGAFESNSLAQVGAFMDATLYGAALSILGVSAIVIFFYSLGALYDDRRDRSILFWKSLPLSDTATVLSKAFSAVILAPAIALVTGVIVGLILSVVFFILASLHGINVWTLLGQAHPFRVLTNLLLLLPLYAIWSLPTLGWLLLCSAWARSKPFLWAIALPVGAGVIVGWLNVMGISSVAGWFWDNVVGRLLGSLIPGIWTQHTSAIVIGDNDDNKLASALHAFDLSYHYSVLATPSAWIGAAAGIAMIAGAIWFRRWRDES